MPRVRSSRPRLSERKALSGDSAQGAKFVKIAPRTFQKSITESCAKGMYSSSEQENLALLAQRSAAALEWAGAHDRQKTIPPAFQPCAARRAGARVGANKLGLSPEGA